LVKRWIAMKKLICRGLGMSALALVLLGAWSGQQAYAQQGNALREQRQQLREERRENRERTRELRQQRQEQMRERGDEMRRPPREREADENQERALNRSEAQKHFPRLGKRFDDIDGNRDGVITRDEVRAFRDARAKARVWAGEGDDPRD
jgi:Sec-independent protein translocase protein TatA